MKVPPANSLTYWNAPATTSSRHSGAPGCRGDSTVTGEEDLML